MRDIRSLLACVALASDFRTLMSKPAGSFEPPKHLPAGTYIGQQRTHKYDKARYDPQPDVVRITFSNLRPTEDVDQAALADIKDLQSRMVSRDFEVTDDQIWKLQAYLESIGAMEPGNPRGLSMAEVLESNSNGKFVLLEVTVKPNKQEPGKFFNNVGKVVGYKE